MENNAPLLLRTKIVIFVVVGILLIEIISRDNDSYRPGFWASKGVDLWISIIKAAGRYFMHFSFWIYERINFKIIAVSIYNLVNPFIYLLCSPLYFWYGSFENTTIFQRIAMISMYIVGLVILIIMEHHFYEKYKPTTLFPFLKKYIEFIYGWAGLLTFDVLQIYRILGLQKFFESAWKILWELIFIAYTPIKSFFEKFSFVGPTTLAGLITIIIFYVYGFQIMGISELPITLLNICAVLIFIYIICHLFGNSFSIYFYC
jgi:hypothetical protein